jgi:hypothetical protein
MLAWITALVLLCGDDTLSREVGSGPEPALAPISWEMDFEYLDPPRRIEVGGTPYFYLVYKVTNTSASTKRFQPTIQLVTEDLRVIETDSGIRNDVFEAIRTRHKQTHPQMIDPVSVIGDLRTGRDYSKESVAIWRANDVTVNNFSIFVAGLSGEAKLVKNPAYDPKKPETMSVKSEDGQTREVVVNPKHFTLRKTLELRYAIPGSTSARDTRDPELIKSRWIMR